MDLLKRLELAKWRGIPFPVTSRNVGFAHENAPHKFQYRNNEYIETGGAKAWTFRYGVPFRNVDSYTNSSLYRRLFSDVLPKFVNAMRDKSPGTLFDPIYGEFRCVPVEFSDDTDISKRDGTDVTIEFVHSPLIDDVPQEFAQNPALSVIIDDDRKLSAEVARQEWEQELPPEATQDPFSIASGTLRQLEFAGNKTLASLEKYIDKLEAVETAADRLGDPRTFSLQRRARRARELAIRAKERAQDPLKRIRRVTTRYVGTLSQIARDFRMTTIELIKLNPSLAGSPEVPAATEISVFAQKPSG